MKSKYYVADTLSPHDVQAAVSLWEKYLPVAPGIGIRKFSWFYDEKSYPKARLWVLKLTDTDEVIGVGGLGYRHFNIKGKSLVGSIGVDLAIEKKYRTLGPALKLQSTIFECAKKTSDFIYGFPSKQAEAVSKHYQYQKIAEFTRLIKILRSVNYISDVVKTQFLARVIAIPTDWLLRVRPTKTFRVSPNTFESEFFEISYTAINRVWNLVARQEILIGERNFEYLAWRYFQCPEVNYRMYGIKDDNNSIRALLIYYIHNNKIEIVDIICRDYNDVTTLGILFANFERFCSLNSFDLIGINLVGTEQIMRLMRSMGYWINKKQRSPIYVYTGDNKNLLAKFIDLENSCWIFGDVF